MTTLATMFSGGGVFCANLPAGVVPIWGIEYNSAVADIYHRNIGECYTADVRQVDYSTLVRPDLLQASTVCKNASQAKTDGAENDEDVSTAQAVCDALRTLRPRGFILENVWYYRTFAAFRLIIRELRNLGYQFGEPEHINAADYGVPQTRQRLILRAVLGGSMRDLVPTCRKRMLDAGQLTMFDSLPWWNGWYAAVADLIPDLPMAELAKWQVEKIEKRGGLFHTCLIHSTNQRAMTMRDADEPAFTVTAHSHTYHAPGGMPRAFLVDSRNSSEPHRGGPRSGDQPAQTVVVARRDSDLPRAFLVDSRNGGKTAGARPRTGDQPAPTVVAADTVNHLLKAVLLDSKNTSQEWGKGYRDADEPAWTVTADDRPSHMPVAWLQSARVVRMTPRAVARFQSIPDRYWLPDKVSLACTVVGNGVPSLLGRILVESFL